MPGKKMALRWCPGKPRPRSASSGGCGGGAPGRSGLLLWKRPWQLPAPSLCGLGWLAALPVSLQQQNQGQSSWLPLHLSVVCLWVSCLSLCASVSLFLSPLHQRPAPTSHFSLLPSQFQGHNKVTSNYIPEKPDPLFTSSEHRQRRVPSLQ